MLKRLFFAVEIWQVLWDIVFIIIQLIFFYFFLDRLQHPEPVFLFFACFILGRTWIRIVLQIIRGEYLTTNWFRGKGIGTEAVFEEVKTTYESVGSSTTGGGSMTVPRYKILVRDVNNNKLYKQSCSQADTTSFTRGDILIVYLHPKCPKWTYRIDLEQTVTMQQH